MWLVSYLALEHRGPVRYAPQLDFCNVVIHTSAGVTDWEWINPEEVPFMTAVDLFTWRTLPNTLTSPSDMQHSLCLFAFEVLRVFRLRLP